MILLAIGRTKFSVVGRMCPCILTRRLMLIIQLQDRQMFNRTHDIPRVPSDYAPHVRGAYTREYTHA